MLRLQRLIKFEYWPFWIFYMPTVIYWLFLSIKAGSITYFTTVNPCMKFGGALEYSKLNYLKHIPKHLLPKTRIINKNDPSELIKKILIEEKFEFPLVIKPDAGQRGVEIEKINNFRELNDFLRNASRPQFLIQEFIKYPEELGILIAKSPDGKSKEITSVTLKKFLSIKGDGTSTIKELISNNIRAITRKKVLFDLFSDSLEQVLEVNKEMILEPIGNHNLGTEFIDGNHLICDQLLKVIDEIVSNVPGFYYGRLDLKAKSIKSLMKGKGIKVLEINGVNSEPAHIYDVNNNILGAYKDLFNHMKIIYEISEQNKQRGEKNDSLKDIIKGIYQLYSH
jgi:hypothetical protein